ncbi:ferritin-like domain-containing protein [Paucibacter sp. APW11]|uniref:Ferritin-like domain-containing protein n=1 Tax=Roseateles aquae TaxID=3077235 RepID=A0ABU3P5M8_9BURK|nr:ferritin-like domain-containing protein [Paucibacter sp. APW11]MDT8997878.1 ferritin-like domain-containing protein [Paucibacter sp. APW11]
MLSLRTAALAPLLATDAVQKAQLTLALDASLPVGAAEVLPAVAGIPGRPARPELVAHVQLAQRSLRTVEGRAALIHSIAHIELNAIDLALDIVWRFPDLPEAFYRDWIAIAKEEAQHFTLLREHLLMLGFDYGDFQAHNALWEMAMRTQDDILARIALVPRTLEARGLDASPAVKRKLVGAGDLRAGEILDVILRDEIGHVAAGNRWYRWVCSQRGLDPVLSYEALVQRYEAPRPRAPFNLAARRAAGFSEEELERLAAP